MINNRRLTRFNINCRNPFWKFLHSNVNRTAVNHNPYLIAIELVSFSNVPMEGNRTVSVKSGTDPES